MTRTFCSQAIVVGTLVTVTRAAHGAAAYFAGHGLADVQGLDRWLVFLGLLSTVWSLVLIRYFRGRGYKLAAGMLTAEAIAGIVYLVLVLRLLAHRHLDTVFLAGLGASLLTGLLTAASVAFSPSRERPWLRVAGLYLLGAGLLSLILLYLSFTSPDYRIAYGPTGEGLLGMVYAIGQLFFLINFRQERDGVEPADPTEDRFEGVLGLAIAAGTVAAVIFIPYLAMNVAAGGERPPGENAKRLAETFSAGVYANGAGDTLRYRLLFPAPYDSVKTYPIVVCLHGSSGCGSDNIRQVGSAAPVQLFLADTVRARYPAFIFVPQCPQGQTWGGLPGSDAIDRLLLEAMTELESTLPIDTLRRYVTGNSLGGYGSWHLITHYPRKFAAAAPLCGGGNPARAQEISLAPVWAFHGADDFIVPVNRSREMIAALERSGGAPRYTEFPRSGHDITRDVLETPGFLEWMFAQRLPGAAKVSGTTTPQATGSGR